LRTVELTAEAAKKVNWQPHFVPDLQVDDQFRCRNDDNKGKTAAFVFLLDRP
jgi:hypothetical protein